MSLCRYVDMSRGGAFFSFDKSRCRYVDMSRVAPGSFFDMSICRYDGMSRGGAGLFSSGAGQGAARLFSWSLCILGICCSSRIPCLS